MSLPVNRRQFLHTASTAATTFLLASSRVSAGGVFGGSPAGNLVVGMMPLHAPIAEGHKSTLILQLGNIAYRTGRVLTCNPKNGRIQK